MIDRKMGNPTEFHLFALHFPVRLLDFLSCVSCISWFSFCSCVTPEQSAADAQAIEVKSETKAGKPRPCESAAQLGLGG
jgi:hypothetical protein